MNRCCWLLFYQCRCMSASTRQCILPRREPVPAVGLALFRRYQHGHVWPCWYSLCCLEQLYLRYIKKKLPQQICAGLWFERLLPTKNKYEGLLDLQLSLLWCVTILHLQRRPVISAQAFYDC